MFIFHSSYFILAAMPSGVIFSETSCRRKIYSNKPTLLLCWTHRYKHSTVVITNWLPIANYQFFRCLWMFSLPHKCFLSSITDTTFTWLHNARWVRVVNPFFFLGLCVFVFVLLISVLCLVSNVAMIQSCLFLISLFFSIVGLFKKKNTIITMSCVGYSYYVRELHMIAMTSPSYYS